MLNLGKNMNQYDLEVKVTNAVNYINLKLKTTYQTELVVDRDKLLTFYKLIRTKSTTDSDINKIQELITLYK